MRGISKGVRAASLFLQLFLLFVTRIIIRRMYSDVSLRFMPSCLYVFMSSCLRAFMSSKFFLLLLLVHFFFRMASDIDEMGSGVVLWASCFLSLRARGNYGMVFILLDVLFPCSYKKKACFLRYVFGVHVSAIRSKTPSRLTKLRSLI